MRIIFRIFLVLFFGLLPVGERFIFAQEAMAQEEAASGNLEAQPSAEGTTTTPEELGGTIQEAASTASGPILEIDRLDTEEPLYSIELRDVDITDLFRILAHDYKFNLMVDKDVQGKVTASLSNVSLEEALETIAESQNLILKKKGSIIKVTPNLITKTFTLKYIEAEKILASSAFETSSSQASSNEGTESSSVGLGATGASTIYDLLSNIGKVLLGRQPNSIIVIDYPPNLEKVGEYLKVVDQRMASRVFKLKYLKATDVVGEASTTQATTGTETTAESTE